MKKLLPLMLALLFLTGCGNDRPSETTADTTPSTQAAPVGLYDPDSAIEAQTAGAVWAYPLGADNYTDVAAMGSRLLLIADDGSLTVLRGEKCQQTATMVTGTALTNHCTSLDTTAQGVTYYLPDSREVVQLNPQLQETNRVQLPQELQGEPVISMANSEIYYCVPGEIRALNLQTDISRLVRSHSYPKQQLTDCCFDGTMLACTVGDDTSAEVLYLSAQTGQSLSDYSSDLYLETAGQSYYAEYMDGEILQRAFGTLEGQPQSLNVENAVLTQALPLGGMVSYAVDEAGLQLSFYDLASGKRTAAVTMEGVADPAAFLATDTHLWILAYEGEQQVLYRWDIAKSPVSEDTVYTGPLYTASNPDTQGLEACQERVDALNKKYGVRIQIWENAVKEPGEYALVSEHQVTTIDQMLDELEPALALFPQKFLQKTVEAGWIRICLVRSTGTEGAYVQYWTDGDCYIAISHDVYNAFLNGVGYAVDSHVLGNSRDFDTWDTLNPEGFAYDLDYALTAQREDAAAYLEGEERAFADQTSMSFPHEDRSRMFACAMKDGSEEIFASAIMQAKLLRLCQGIREAYGLEKSTEVYPWEQYLTESIAYKK